MNHDQMQGRATITCRDSVRMVSLLRDGELDTDGQTLLHAHISGCARCQVARRQFETLYAGLDDLLARVPAPGVVVATQTQDKFSRAQGQASQPKSASWPRRRWLGLGSAGVGLALLGTWWTLGSVQMAQNTDDFEQLAIRIAQYQLLYTRDTLQDAPSTALQREQVLREWVAKSPSARFLRKPPQPTIRHLQLARAQRLGWGGRAILQWVYLPEQGQPVALCAMALQGPDGASPPFFEGGSASTRSTFSVDKMRGVHWQDRGVFWVLVAAQEDWSERDLQDLQRTVAAQLLDQA